MCIACDTNSRTYLLLKPLAPNFHGQNYLYGTLVLINVGFARAILISQNYFSKYSYPINACLAHLYVVC